MLFAISGSHNSVVEWWKCPQGVKINLNMKWVIKHVVVKGMVGGWQPSCMEILRSFRLLDRWFLILLVGGAFIKPGPWLKNKPNYSTSYRHEPTCRANEKPYVFKNNVSASFSYKFGRKWDFYPEMSIVWSEKVQGMNVCRISDFHLIGIYVGWPTPFLVSLVSLLVIEGP